jgi:hypothetical protein
MAPNFLLKSILLGMVFVLLSAWQCGGAPLEELLAAEATPAGIDVIVATGGCTKKSDFEINSSPITNGKASVELRRLSRDTCKGNFPNGLKLQFSWADLKLPEGTKLSIKNLGVQPNKPPVSKNRKARRRLSTRRRLYPSAQSPRHRHIRRHRRSRAKLGHGARRQAMVFPEGGKPHLCGKGLRPRSCRHLKHASADHRRHRAHCR